MKTDARILTPAELAPVVPIHHEGAGATCPRCGTKNLVRFEGLYIEWWADPAKGHCVHFQGFYSTGSLYSVEARFQ